MSRRAIHIDPDGRWGRALRAIVAPRRPPPPRFVMSCVGCDTVDAHDVWWARPGLCIACSPREDKIVRCTPRVERMIIAAAVAALKTMRRTFRVPSLLVLAFHGGDDLLKEDAAELRDGKQLDATTIVRICRDRSWTAKLVWRKRDEHGVKITTTQSLCFRMRTPKRRRR